MAAQVLYARVCSVFRNRERMFTTFVNTSVVSGPENKLVKQLIVVKLQMHKINQRDKHSRLDTWSWL